MARKNYTHPSYSYTSTSLSSNKISGTKRVILSTLTIIVSCLVQTLYAQNNAVIRVFDNNLNRTSDSSQFPRHFSSASNPHDHLQTSPRGPDSNPQCEYNWHRFEDKCFFFLGTSSSHTFEEARYECSKYYRAGVATIKSEAEQKFVESILKGNVIYNNVWLGSRYVPETIESKGGFYWVDGEPVIYHNKLLSSDLIRGNKSTMCLAMFMHTQFFGIWTPFNCNYYFHVLCERNLRAEMNSAQNLTSTSLAIMSTLIFFSFLMTSSKRLLC